MKYLNELNRIISMNVGFTMMVKGMPGSGKTTFLLTLSDYLKDSYEIIYFSTRVNVDVLYNQFPWLKSLEKKISLVISSQALLKILYEDNLKEKNKENLRQNAKEVISNTVEEKMITRIFYNKYFKMKAVPEIDYIYKKLEEDTNKKYIVIIDSIEGLASKYNIDEESLVISLQEDIFKKTNDIFIFSVEKTEESSLDALCDVILEFSYDIEETRRIRKLRINKLRNTHIDNSLYLFSLNEGRFNILKPNIQENYEEGSFKPVLEDNENFKLPWNEINEALGNGLEKGKTLTFYFCENISYGDYFFIIIPIILNSLNNRKLIYIPSPIVSRDFYFNTLKKYFDDSIILNNSYLFDKDAREREKSIVPLSHNPYDLKITLKNIIQENSMNKIVIIINVDTLELIFGTNKSNEIIMDIIRMIKIYSVPLILLVRYPFKMADEILQMSDYVFNVKNNFGTLTIYGIRPSTNLFGLEIDDGKYPNLRLIPIV